jgi:hypothetical protein
MLVNPDYQVFEFRGWHAARSGLAELRLLVRG